MPIRMRAAVLALAITAALAACSGVRPGVFAPDYEYEEDLTLSLDGSGTLAVNTSVPALAALRGIHLSADSGSRVDVLKDQVRAAYTSPYAEVTGVSVWN